MTKDEWEICVRFVGLIFFVLTYESRRVCVCALGATLVSFAHRLACEKGCKRFAKVAAKPFLE